MTDAGTRAGNPLLVFFLPSIHLGASLALWFGHVNSGWYYLLIIDFPFSAVLGALMFEGVNQLIIFGILGTLWWYFLSLMIRRFVARRRRENPYRIDGSS